jgi:transcriptional/translational regulatory protein YebC/TACO1
MTDNKNRAVAEVRHAFSKFGGNLGADGSVGFLFNHVGLLQYPPGSDEEALMDAAIEAGAEDVVVDEDKSVEVLTDPASFEQVRDAMKSAGFAPEHAEVTMRASNSTELELQAASSMIKMLEMLDADISDEILAQL